MMVMSGKHTKYQNKINRSSRQIDFSIHTQPNVEREKAVKSLKDALRLSIQEKSDRYLVNALVAKLEYSISKFNPGLQKRCLDNYRNELERLPRHALESEFVAVQSSFLSHGIDVAEINIQRLNLLTGIRNSIR